MVYGSRRVNSRGRLDNSSPRRWYIYFWRRAPAGWIVSLFLLGCICFALWTKAVSFFINVLSARRYTIFFSMVMRTPLRTALPSFGDVLTLALRHTAQHRQRHRHLNRQNMEVAIQLRVVLQVVLVLSNAALELQTRRIWVAEGYLIHAIHIRGVQYLLVRAYSV